MERLLGSSFGGVRDAGELFICFAGRMFKTKVSKIVVERLVSKTGQGGVSIVDADLRFGAWPSLGVGRSTLPGVASVGQVKVREHYVPCRMSVL